MKLRNAIRAAGAAILTSVLAAALCASGVQQPKGFDKKVYNASMALYASSVSADIDTKFICTVTAFKHVKGGYLLIGAGHCTSANDELPSDLTYGVADDINKPVHSIRLLKSVMDEPLDYAIYFYPTTAKYPTIALGDESDVRVGSKTTDTNFSLGAAKMVSPGVIASVTLDNGGDVSGFYLVDEFGSHGASGSAVVSEKTHKIIGLVIAGWDGATMPMVIEPITAVEKAMADVTVYGVSQSGGKTSIDVMLKGTKR